MNFSRTQQRLTIGFGIVLTILLCTAALVRQIIVNRGYPLDLIEKEGNVYAVYTNINSLLVEIEAVEMNQQVYLDIDQEEILDQANEDLENINSYFKELFSEYKIISEDSIYSEGLNNLESALEKRIQLLRDGIDKYQTEQLDLSTRLNIAQQQNEARLDTHLALEAFLEEVDSEWEWGIAETEIRVNNDLWLTSMAFGLGSISLSILYGWLMLTLRQNEQISTDLKSQNQALTLQLNATTVDLQDTKNTLKTELNHRQELETTYKEIEQAKELTDLKLNFFSLASHELRTPLSAILVSAQLLDNPNVEWSEEKRSRNLRRIQSSAKTMTQLLADILLLTRAEAGKLEFNPQMIELQVFCGRLVEEVKFNTQAQHRILLLQQGECEYAYLDEKLLRAMLMSLITNAIKYSPPESEIQFTILGENGHTQFQISDQGIGIPPTDQHHLFESFHRGQNVEMISGTGLGLAVVKKCLSLHGGDIQVESQVGVGTTFTVDIPWAEQSIVRPNTSH
ncbi:MAG: HAMP domain-containing sensor histidine kinase [Leptolyngbyaceae cyanobacterium MO_188.B28]|nr:HAMP domain-containing sensor histidine kinase [Leptolyngbyaceae cyanobacterium MO_188.B28]